MSNGKKPLHVQVAEKLIEQLKAGTAPWQKPWSNGAPVFELPYNAITGNRYKGINTITLMMNPYDDPRWMTFNQASSQDWKVKKGEKGSLIQFVKLTDLVTRRDEQGKPVLNPKGEPVKISVKLAKPIITSSWVFNAQQVDGVPELQKPDIKSLGWNPVERAEQLVISSGAQVNNRKVDRAFYSPLNDQITMPLKAQFDAPDKYYATLLHELGHWTGHSTRLDRSIMNRFGTEAYAREELRAEIFSMLIGQEMKIEHDPGKHAAYVDSWVKILTDTPFEIHSASVDAEKIFTYMMDIERKRDIKTEIKPNEPAAARPASNQKHLAMGDEIDYNDSVYKVLGHIKQGRLRMEEVGSGTSFVLSRTDGLYASLLTAKQGGANHHKVVQPKQMISEPEPATEREEVITAAYGIRR